MPTRLKTAVMIEIFIVENGKAAQNASFRELFSKYSNLFEDYFDVGSSL